MIAAVLAFCRSPAAWVLAAFIGGLWYGNSAGAARTEARWQTATAAELARQADAANAALDAARRREEAAAGEIQALEQKVTTYEAELADRGDACRLSDDDARRLRDIR